MDPYLALGHQSPVFGAPVRRLQRLPRNLGLDVMPVPIGSKVVPVWGYLFWALNINHRKELLWSL